MPAELEDAEDAHEPNDPEYGQRHGLVGALVLWRDRTSRQVERVLLFGHHRGQRDEVRNDCDDVDEVHDVTEEVELVGARKEAHGELEREPDDTNCFYEEEGVRYVGHLSTKNSYGHLKKVMSLNRNYSFSNVILEDVIKGAGHRREGIIFNRFFTSLD